VNFSIVYYSSNIRYKKQEKNIKSCKKEVSIKYPIKKIRVTADFSTETGKARRT
jgi:hypothetical protein